MLDSGIGESHPDNCEVKMDKIENSEVLNVEGDQDSSSLPIEDMTFEDIVNEKLPRGPEVIQGIYGLGYARPSKVQCQAIPLMLQTPPKSVLVQSPAGTGKTLAFIIPMNLRVDSDLPELQAICLEPTRELVIQSKNAFEKLSKYSKLNVAIAVKSGKEAEAEAIPENVQVLFGTPASVSRLGNNDEGKKPNFAHLKLLVVDEADAIVGKETPHFKSVRFILKHIPLTCQLGFFSTTYSKQDIKYLERFDRDLQHITIPLTEDNRQHYFIQCTRDSVQSLFINMLKTIKMESAYVYVSRKDDTDVYVQLLRDNGFTAGKLTSELTADERDATMEQFQNGDIKFLVTVKAFSRGLDNPKVSHVFNIDLPIPILKNVHEGRGNRRKHLFDDVDSYVHRAGSAGRFGRKGVVITFSKNERDYRTLQSVSKCTGITLHEIDSNTFKETEKKTGLSI